MSGGMQSRMVRGIATGALIELLGIGLLILALSGTLSTWLAIPAGLLILVGFLRVLGMLGVAAFERQRRRLLEQGVVGTAVVEQVERIDARGSEAVFDMQVTVSAPEIEPQTVKKRGAVPPVYAGEMVVGAKFPVRLDPRNPGLFAIDWDAA